MQSSFGRPRWRRRPQTARTVLFGWASGGALLKRYEAHRAAGDLDRESALEAAVAAVAPTNPDRPAILNNFGRRADAAL